MVMAYLVLLVIDCFVRFCEREKNHAKKIFSLFLFAEGNDLSSRSPDQWPMEETTRCVSPLWFSSRVGFLLVRKVVHFLLTMKKNVWRKRGSKSWGFVNVRSPSGGSKEKSHSKRLLKCKNTITVLTTMVGGTVAPCSHWTEPVGCCA